MLPCEQRSLISPRRTSYMQTGALPLDYTKLNSKLKLGIYRQTHWRVENSLRLSFISLLPTEACKVNYETYHCSTLKIIPLIKTVQIGAVAWNWLYWTTVNDGLPSANPRGLFYTPVEATRKRIGAFLIPFIKNIPHAAPHPRGYCVKFHTSNITSKPCVAIKPNGRWAASFLPLPV